MSEESEWINGLLMVDRSVFKILGWFLVGFSIMLATVCQIVDPTIKSCLIPFNFLTTFPALLQIFFCYLVLVICAGSSKLTAKDIKKHEKKACGRSLYTAGHVSFSVSFVYFQP